MNRSTHHGKSGFTLIELIVVLLLVSILAATVGLILTTFIKSYLVVKQSADVSQKAQMALRRLRLEFENISDVNMASPTSIYYRIKTSTLPETDRVAGLDGTCVKIGTALPVSAGNSLVDGVVSFALNFFDENGNLSGVSSWSSTGSWGSPAFSSLYAIRIDLTIAHDSGNIFFSTIVYPGFNAGHDIGPLNWNSQ
jgi:prepilin-type N-terminal cleavage/methylation domain-containing protein